MKPAPISVQLYSVRAQINERGLPALLKTIADIGYAGVEFAGYKGLAPAELRKILDDLGLRASSTHGALPTSKNLKEIVEDARALGFTTHVCGPGFGNKVASRDEVLRAAAELQAGAELLRREGLRLAVHNHEYEFDRVFDGQTPHEILRDHAPDLLFELDTYWAAVGGHDPAKVLRQLGARAPLLHIKDGPKQRAAAMTAVGRGAMEWAPVFAAADEKALEWAIVELDACETDMVAAVADSYAYLVSTGYAVGRRTA